MIIYTRWNTGIRCENEPDTIDLLINNIIINFTCEEAEEVFKELSRILYGRVLED